MNAEEPVTPRPEWNTGGADHDQPYRFGRPEVYLTLHERARLHLRRSRIADRELLRYRRGTYAPLEDLA